MTLREVVTVPNPVLRRKARPVTYFDRDLQSLIDDMIETMRAAPGVGLAAPQVDVPLRVIIVEYAEESRPEPPGRVAGPSRRVEFIETSSRPHRDPVEGPVEGRRPERRPEPVEGPVEGPQDESEKVEPKLYVVVNPEIVKASAESEAGVEGCLSVPGLVGEVERPLAVTVKGLNRHGRPMRVKAKGWLGRIFQHEIDHLNGILFTDRALRIWQPQPEEAEVEV